jgi:hypothetical protein
LDDDETVSLDGNWDIDTLSLLGELLRYFESAVYRVVRADALVELGADDQPRDEFHPAGTQARVVVGLH